MRLLPVQNRRSLFVISWLLARLWIGAEMSRLAIFRLRPKPFVHQWQRNRLLATPGHWIFDRNKLFYLAVNDSENQLTISQTQPFESN